MVDESFTFGLSTLGTVVGIAILLYGVTLTAGQEVTTPMIAGGIVILAAISLHTAALMSLDDGHAAA